MTDGPQKQPEQKPTAQSWIYIGPTLPPSLAPLPQYIVYAKEIPPQFEPLFKQCPAIRELFVPTSDLGRARLAMAKPGTREHSFSVAVQKFIASGPPRESETVGA